MTSADLSPDPLPLASRTVLITGVSRRAGIGHAIACLAAAAEAAADVGHPLAALVCNQAMSELDSLLLDITEDVLDRHWAVNARASILLAQAFARAVVGGRAGGAEEEPAAPSSDPARAIVFLTSGQAQGPLPGEIAYGAAKAAIAGITLTIADELADHGIRVNTVNPGPVDTG